MEFDIARAVLGGLIGTIAMTVVMYMGSIMMGLKMDMPMTLGTMLFRKGAAAWIVGLMMHLMMGGSAAARSMWRNKRQSCAAH